MVTAPATGQGLNFGGDHVEQSRGQAGLPPPGFKGCPGQACAPKTPLGRAALDPDPQSPGEPCGGPARGPPLHTPARAQQPPSGIDVEFKFYNIMWVHGCDRFDTNSC